MRRIAGRPATIVATVALVVAACTPAGAGPSTGADGTLGVVVTTTVIGDLVERVGGEGVVVTSLVPKGGEVHTYDPRPSDLVTVAEASLVVMNGLGLDEWLGGLATDAGTSAPVVRLGEELEGVAYLEGGDHGHAEDGGAGGEEHADEAGVNPHLWLDVTIAARYVDRIADALASVDPAGADGYRARAAAERASLADLDAWVRERIATIPAERRSFVSFHDALPYYAAAYGLEIVGVVVEAPGQEPSAGEIADLVAAIRASGVRAVFSESQFDPALARTLADEAGATVVANLYTDTLGDPPVDSYEGLVRWNTDRIVEALR
ncbi:MAG: hypothetical protein RL338_666 [Chloroflexota bacterium]|jgi:ABC-type Zn uptake system ZnuABC Zn-binding protein ZnuA